MNSGPAPAAGAGPHRKVARGEERYFFPPYRASGVRRLFGESTRPVPLPPPFLSAPLRDAAFSPCRSFFCPEPLMSVSEESSPATADAHRRPGRACAATNRSGENRLPAHMLPGNGTSRQFGIFMAAHLLPRAVAGNLATPALPSGGRGNNLLEQYI